jgi:uncharacterized protein YaiE (UPF0345 family)
MIKHNAYFDGKVQSLSIDGQDKPATVGVMSVGDYTFGTDAPELMTVVSGELHIQKAKEDSWTIYKSGESFSVAGNSSFLVKVPMATAYLCVYG